MNKNEVSLVKQINREWTKIDNGNGGLLLPKYDTPVTVRIVDYSKIVDETNTGIMYLEDIKIARIKVHDNGMKWVIEGPFPIFDFSPLTYFDALKTGAIVTHWSPCTDKELEFWSHRFDVRGDYKFLELKVDEDHKELMYRALMHASIYMRYAIKNIDNDQEKDKMISMLNAIYDLQSVMDCGGSFQKSNDEDTSVTSTESE